MEIKAFSGLSPAQTERLDMLAEECAEVIQAVSKIKRHGFESRNPDAPEKGTNRVQLQRELADVLAIMQMMEGVLDIEWPDGVTVADARRNKARYVHHQ